MIVRKMRIRYKRRVSVGLLLLAASLPCLLPAPVGAQGVTTVEIENVQLVRSLTGVVHDAAGSPMPGVLVEELSSDWKESLRSTRTDAAGVFRFSRVKGRDIYHFQLRTKAFNPLRVRVKVDRFRGKKLDLQMEVST
jgi:hypothetical protein